MKAEALKQNCNFQARAFSDLEIFLLASTPAVSQDAGSRSRRNAEEAV